MRSRNRRLLSLLLVALASVAALALAACGGGDDDSGDAKQQLSDAFKTPIKSANLSLDVSAKVDGVPQLSQPVSLKLTGPYETRGQNKVPKLDWDVNVSGAGQTFTGSLVSTGDNAFIGFQDQNYEVGSEVIKQFEQQAAQQTQQQGLSLQQLGIDPVSWVKDAKEDGEEDVAGTKTTKITGGLDVEAMLNDLNGAIDKAGPAMGQNAQKLTPEQIQQVKQVVKDPTFEAFVAEDKTLRRLSATINFTIPESQRQQASGATGGNVKFSIQFANVGQPATVEAPTDARPLSELQQQIQSGGLGGIGGSGSSGDSGGSGGSGSGGSGGEEAPSSDDFEKYAKCLEDAQGDSAAIEECSKLLR